MPVQALITGSTGQIGAALAQSLAHRLGSEAVLATAPQAEPTAAIAGVGYEPLDVTDAAAVEAMFQSRKPRVVYHLAALLSVTGEKNPELAWRVNLDGLRYVLEAARRAGVNQVFWPSSIAVFGPDSPRDPAPQTGSLRPTTLYGITKVAGELLCDYCHRLHGLDVRGVRYPGVISSEQPPGGGTTDYAVEMFYAAVRGEPYTCFVRPDTVLPMIYMPDCIEAALRIMEADGRSVVHRNSANVAAMSFSAGELAAAIRRRVPEFECRYEPDHRQRIADSWPRTIDDSAARREWGWQPKYDLPTMVDDMLAKLRERLR